MNITIADRNSDAEALAKLFVANLHANYISHSELQGSRALAPAQWAPNIEEILLGEIRMRLGEPLLGFPRDRSWLGIIQAYEGGTLIGLAYVGLRADAPRPFGVVEDIVIDVKRRAAGLGEELMCWILDRFAEVGIRRTFLESGDGNESAHKLFEHLGFKKVSIVMMRDGGLPKLYF